MKISRWLVLAGMAVAVSLCASAESAHAQGYGRRPVRTGQRSRGSRPRVSPYLNLLGGAAGGAEYQALVRPLQESRDAQERQSRDLESLQFQFDEGQALAETPFGGPISVRQTGHASTYFNLSHYYGSATTGGGRQKSGGRAGAGGRGAGGRRAPSRGGSAIGGGFGGGW